MADDTGTSGTNLTPTHGVLLVLISSAVVLGTLMGFGFRPKKSSK